MALIAASVANDGVMMAPHVLQDVRDRDGNVVQSYTTHAWRTTTSNPSTAGRSSTRRWSRS